MDTQRVKFYSTCFHKNGATIGGAYRYPGLTNLRARSTIDETTSVPAGHRLLVAHFHAWWCAEEHGD